MLTIQEQTNKLLNEFKRDVVDNVRTIFKQDKIIHPILMALILEKDKRPTIGILGGLGTHFADDEGKERVREIIRDFSKEVKPIAIAFAYEAWVTVMPTEKASDYLNEDGTYKSPDKRPSKDPNRKECVVVTFETCDKQACTYWEINRDLYPQLVEMENTQWEEKIPTKGMFMGLLEDNYSELAEYLKKEALTKQSMN